MDIHQTSILIVEDNLEILDLLKNVLQRHFNTVFTATNGKLAHAIVSDKNPDLILTDIVMPEQSGIDFAIKIRAEGKTTPIIMISGTNDKDDLLKAIKIGVKDFIEKPFNVDEVEKIVHRVLEVSLREANLPEMITRYGLDSIEVLRHKRLIGLLQAISSKT